MKHYLLILLGLFGGNSLFAQENDSDCYELGYERLDSMLSGGASMNIKQAVYAVENSYYNGHLDYRKFDMLLQQYVSFCRNLSKNKLITYNQVDYRSVNTHAAIFKMMTDSISVYMNDSTIAYHLPMHYNFDDYAGQKNWLLLKKKKVRKHIQKLNIFMPIFINWATGKCRMPCI